MSRQGPLALLIGALVLVGGCGGGGGLFGTPTPAPGQPTPGPGQPTPGPGEPTTPVGPGLPTPAGPIVLPTMPGGQPQAGPPAWLDAGVRLTWYVAAASVAQSRYSFVEEPCTPSSWRTQDGKCYRRTDESGEGQGGGSGDGYSQLDVIAFDGGRVSLNSDLYGIDRGNNVFLWTALGGASVDAQSLEGAWANPAELARMAGQGVAGLLVLRGPFQLGNNTFDSVALVSGLGTSAYQSFVYDLASGLLLSTQSSTAGSVSPVRAVGEDAPVGNSLLTMARFVGLRTRTLPGHGAANPDWLARMSELTYAGIRNWTNPVDPSSGNLNFEMSHVVAFSAGGASWANFSARTVVPGLALDSTLRGVAGSTGPYWYSPGALAAMSSAQLLDSDPVTGERTTVLFTGQGATGGQVVTLETSMPGVTNRFTYDATSGMLLAFESLQPATGMTTTLQLAGTR